jgi:8-amino-7-oxononanoate synthase
LDTSAPLVDCTDPPAGPGLGWLAGVADARTRAGLHRELVARPPGPDWLVDLAGNDYLALSGHLEVVSAAMKAVRDYGAGSTGSRLVTGTTQLHVAFEQALAGFCQAPSALVFSSGYLANLAAVGALADDDALIVSAASNHASLIDACRLSRARVLVVPDDDPDAVRTALKNRHEARALVVTDAVFSVSGRLAPLAELYHVALDAGAVLLVDEAHALGVIGVAGDGACAAAGIASEPDVVRTVTLSKALGSQGGAVLGPAVLRDHLIATARPFIFDTALAPASVGAALAALGLITPHRVASLRAAARRIAELLELSRPDAAVLNVPVPDPLRAVAVRDDCAREAIRVGCFRPPSVPPGRSCLRVTARADLARTDIDRAVKVIANALARSHP